MLKEGRAYMLSSLSYKHFACVKLILTPALENLLGYYGSVKNNR